MMIVRSPDVKLLANSCWRNAKPYQQDGDDKLRLVSTEELLIQVLQLPRTERARLAEDVLTSLEEPGDRVAAAWVPELVRRSIEIADGRVQPVDWETARLRILEELDSRRARRSSS